MIVGPARTCQWIGPEQDPARGSVEYCGKPSFPGKSYCEEHVWRVYQKGTAFGTKRKIAKIEKELKVLEEIAEDEQF